MKSKLFGDIENQVYTILGHPNSGKSSVLLNESVHMAAKLGKKVCHITTEITPTTTWEHILSIVSGKSVINESTVKEYMPKLSNLHVHALSDMTIGELINITQIDDYDIVVIDYIGMINSANKSSNQFNTMIFNMAMLEKLSEVYSIPIITAIQANRDGYNGSGIGGVYSGLNYHLRLHAFKISSDGGILTIGKLVRSDDSNVIQYRFTNTRELVRVEKGE